MLAENLAQAIKKISNPPDNSHRSARLTPLSEQCLAPRWLCWAPALSHGVAEPPPDLFMRPLV